MICIYIILKFKRIHIYIYIIILWYTWCRRVCWAITGSQKLATARNWPLPGSVPDSLKMVSESWVMSTWGNKRIFDSRWCQCSTMFNPLFWNISHVVYRLIQAHWIWFCKTLLVSLHKRSRPGMPTGMNFAARPSSTKLLQKCLKKQLTVSRKQLGLKCPS